MEDKKSNKPKDNLEKKIAELEEKCSELEEKRLRALADYQNLVKRTEEERAQIIKNANERLIKSLLVIIDDLEEAAKHIKEDWIVKVLEKFNKILSEEGLEQSGFEGDEFDPSAHDAIEKIEGEEGKIAKVHRKGYKLRDKVIRAAIVAVGESKSKSS